MILITSTTASFPIRGQWIDNKGEKITTPIWDSIHEDETQVEGIPKLNVDLRLEDHDQQDGQENEKEEANCRYCWMDDSTTILLILVTARECLNGAI